jgi:polyhydroxybutyrate depolymerase
VKVPTAAREGRALPLVLALHGGGGTGLRMHQLTGLDATAEKYGFFLVYPEGIEKNWNDGRADMRSTAAREEVPDVDFLRTILDETRTTYLVDESRVYVTGMSNGSMMSSRLACELADRVAAVALVAGPMPRSIQPQCAPARPVSVMILHGTEDPIVPYEGGEVKLRGLPARGMVISAEATASEWARHDGCEAGATERAIPDTNAMDGSSIRVQAWSRCKEGTAVELWKILGGGHTWPGGWQYLNEKFIGTTNRDIDAREEIWRFFAAHSRARAKAPVGAAQ